MQKMLAEDIIHEQHVFSIYASEVLAKFVTCNVRLSAVSNDFSPSIAQKAADIKLLLFKLEETPCGQINTCFGQVVLPSRSLKVIYL